MLTRLLIAGFLITLPQLAAAQTQLLLLQEQRVWHLQQQERQRLAAQLDRRQEQLLQQQFDLPPLPEPRLGVPADDLGRRSLDARLQAERLELLRQDRQLWQRSQQLLVQQPSPQDRMRDLQLNQQLQLQLQQQQLQQTQQQQRQWLLQQHLMEQQQRLDQLQRQTPQ